MFNKAAALGLLTLVVRDTPSKTIWLKVDGGPRRARRRDEGFDETVYADAAAVLVAMAERGCDPARIEHARQVIAALEGA